MICRALKTCAFSNELSILQCDDDNERAIVRFNDAVFEIRLFRGNTVHRVDIRKVEGRALSLDDFAKLSELQTSIEIAASLLSFFENV